MLYFVIIPGLITCAVFGNSNDSYNTVEIFGNAYSSDNMDDIFGDYYETNNTKKISSFFTILITRIYLRF
jgi:hypothetical protein